MRWKAVGCGLVLALAVLAGCKEQCFLTECDWNHYQDVGLPARVESDPSASVVPCPSNVAAPATTRFPSRPMKPMTLNEAIALALEQGTVGSPALNGTTNDSLATFANRTVSPAESPIRVLALEPAIVGSDIESSLSKFDARWTSSMTWHRFNQPVGGNILTSFQNGDQDTFTTSLLKPLPTGGVTGITFTDAYTFLSAPPPGITNPAHRPTVQFQFEQPLLQGFGVDINQLRAQHPGSILTPFNNTSRVEGIIITRLRFDEQRAEFERQVSNMLVNVETAYWNLYGAYFNLYSQEQGMRMALAVWQASEAQFRAGTMSADRVEQARGQYELFRGQRLTGLQGVLDAEHQLRGLLSLPIEDGTRLVPVDVPTTAPYLPDWHTSLNEALTLRPELVLARQDLKFRQLDLINQKNLLMPDLRFVSTYDLNGLGTRLDGAQIPTVDNGFTGNALRSMADNEFHDWQLELRLDIPIGFRDAHAGVRAARLRLLQSYLTLRDQEQRAIRLLGQQYQQMISSYDNISPQRAQRLAFAAQANALLQNLSAGTPEAGQGRIELTAILDAIRFYSEAVRTEYTAVVEYNNALARFEFAKGTILQHNNVVISEGLLPHCAQVRAVEHERQRALGLLARERANVEYHPVCPYVTGLAYGLPQLPAGVAPAVPAVLPSDREPPAVTEKLPEPRRLETPEDAKPLPAPRPAESPAETEQLPQPRPAPASETPRTLPPTDPAGKPAPAPTGKPADLSLSRAGWTAGDGVVQASYQAPAGAPPLPGRPADGTAARSLAPRAAVGMVVFPAPATGKTAMPAPGAPPATACAEFPWRASPATDVDGCRMTTGLIYFTRPAATPALAKVAPPAAPPITGAPGLTWKKPRAADNRQAALVTSLKSAMLPSDREAAAEALARSAAGDPVVIDALWRQAAADPAPTVRRTCVRGLGSAGTKAAGVRERLQQLQSDPDAGVRQEAGRALQQLNAAAVRSGS
jgi:outer membrane protein TolC